MSAPKLELIDVSKTFRGKQILVPALASFSLVVEPAEFLTIIGPSGSGKSTLFNLIAGLLEPDQGQILLDGRPAPRRTGRFGYMPQKDLLLPWRNVLDNVVLAQELAGVPRSRSTAAATELLPLFGLEGFSDAFPASLSGGMRQRAAMLRTTLSDREVLLLDEPFGALDALTRFELQDWLLGIWDRYRQTVLFVTHDVEEALYLGDRVVVLSPRPGRVLHSLSVELPRPRRREMTTFDGFRRQLAELLGMLEGSKDG